MRDNGRRLTVDGIGRRSRSRRSSGAGLLALALILSACSSSPSAGHVERRSSPSGSTAGVERVTGGPTGHYVV